MGNWNNTLSNLNIRSFSIFSHCMLTLYAFGVTRKKGFFAPIRISQVGYVSRLVLTHAHILCIAVRPGLPAVITLSAPATDTLVDGVTVVDACRRLEEAGAAVVGLNCGRGPATMLPLIREIRAVCKVSSTYKEGSSL